MIGRWYDPPYMPIVPVCEPSRHEIPLELGHFSTKQRNWILRRDNYHCQFPDCKFDASQVGGRGLHAHHIIPAGFYKTWFTGISDDPHERTENFPENGIMLCGKNHHNGPNGIHPDYYRALMEYRKGNKDAFRNVSHEHWIKETAGDIYWNDKWDKVLWDIAQERTRIYLMGHPRDVFPYDIIK